MHVFLRVRLQRDTSMLLFEGQAAVGPAPILEKLGVRHDCSVRLQCTHAAVTTE